jgi:hypothetical protein
MIGYFDLLNLFPAFGISVLSLAGLGGSERLSVKQRVLVET